MAATWICASCRRLATNRSGVGGAVRASVSALRHVTSGPLIPKPTASRSAFRGHIKPFTVSRSLREDEQLDAKDANSIDGASTGSRNKTKKRKSARSGTSTSLRKIAAEAQRERDSLVRGTGRRRFLDPGADTREVTASCAAEQYNLKVAKGLLRQDGYEIDPLGTGLYPQVVHIQTPIYPVKASETGDEERIGPGDIFIFPSGSVVSWNVPEKVQRRLVQRVLLPAAVNPHSDAIELEDMEYLEDPTRSSSEVVGDAIVLGTQSQPTTLPFDHADTEGPPRSPAVDLVLAKIAFSSGLARSTKLAVLENLLSSYFETTKSIPTILSRGSALRFTRSFILRKTGELLSIRAQLNLYSELTDTMPDLFWDSPSQLGLSDYYDEVGKALDVNARIRSLNEKMDYASEIASVLRERLSEKHSTGLEWLIIFLISVEVGFELLRLWRERTERSDARDTHALAVVAPDQSISTSDI